MYRGCVCAYPQILILCGGGRPKGGVLYVTRQRQIPLDWEGWVAPPVDRSQAFTGRVPSSGHLGGTAFQCSLCSSLFEIPRTRIIVIYNPTGHTKTVFRLPWMYL